MADMSDTPNIAHAAPPAGAALPSSRALLRSTLIAAVTAAVLLVTVVLPAEYGVDPTGVGRVLGLTQMGEIKRTLAQENEAADAAVAAAAAPSATTAMPATAMPATVLPATAAPATAASPAPTTTTAPAALAVAPAKVDTAQLVLQPGEGKEIKLAMRKGARVQYRWTTEGGAVNYDTHADRSAPPAISYHGYGKGQNVTSDDGVLVAAFDGMHGWYWRNRTRAPVTVTLRTEGDYQELKRME